MEEIVFEYKIRLLKHASTEGDCLRTDVNTCH